MVFGFFSRKAPQASESPFKLPVQLRTPSPSVDGQFLHPNASPSLGPPATPSPTPDAVQTTFNPPIADATELQSFISSIPPKTFHEYTVSHLTEEPPSQEIIDALSSFFSQLTRPPQLHCVRCHKSYFDVENGDRSCLVAHDDDSATVERVSGAYETLYGCCEKTVEGDGDMGPPDGYCYEGKHTTDIKRARFRADSSIHDDKLTSCAMMRCFDPPPSPPSDSEGSVASKRKIRRRPRRSVKAADNDDARSTTSSKGKRKRPITDEGDVPDVPAIPVTPKSTRMRPPGAQEEEESTDEEEATVVNDADMPSISSAVKAKSKPAPKSRKKRAKTTIDDKPFKPSMGSDADDMDVDDAASSASKPRRKPTVSRKKATRPPQTPSPAPPSSAPKSRIPFLTSEASASPILKPSRSSHSPTRSVAGARHGRNVSFSSRTQSVEVVVERQLKPKPLGEVVATSISGEE